MAEPGYVGEMVNSLEGSNVDSLSHPKVKEDTSGRLDKSEENEEKQEVEPTSSNNEAKLKTDGLTLSAEDEDKPGFFGKFNPMRSRTLKEVLKHYRLELRKIGKLDSMKLIWTEEQNTMYNFKLINTFDKTSQKLNSTEALVEFDRLALGVEYKLEVSANMQKNKNDGSLTFRTRPKAAGKIRLNGNRVEWDEAVGADHLKVKITAGGKTVDRELKGYDRFTTIENPVIGEIIRVEIEAFRNDERLTNTSSKDLRVGGDVVPYNVTAVPNDRDVYRSIKVTWDKPDSDKHVKCYIVTILCTTREKYKKEKTVGGTQCVFEGLMSQSGYICAVRAKYHTGQPSEPSRSNIVRTKYKKRQFIDISELGKPQKFKKNPTYGKGVICEMTWQPAQLGTYSNDYEIVNVKTSMAELQQTINRQLEAREFSVNNNSAKATLQWGRKYKFRHSVFYKDLDTLTETEAILLEAINTRCEEVSDISIEEKNSGKVIITWEEARGASKYLFEIYDGATILYEKGNFQTETSHSFETSYEVSNGREYTFEVHSFDAAMEKKTGTFERFLGPRAPTQLKLQQDENDPHRKLTLRWKPPREGKPTEYEYCLYDEANVKVDEPKKTTDVSAEFSRLKQGSRYFAIVWALYGNKRGLPSYSNKRATKLGLKLLNAQLIQSEGKVKDLKGVTSPKSSSENHSLYKLEWTNPPLRKELLDHYDLHGMLLQVFEKNSMSQFSEDVDCAPTKIYKKEVDLVRGKDYLIRISAVYRKIDDGDETRAVFEKSLKTDIDPPQNIVVTLISQEVMKISWSACKSCASFTWEILDSSGLEVLEQKTTSKLVNDIRLAPQYSYGKTCRFRVTAIAQNGVQRSHMIDPMIIGGEKVPYDVNCRKNHTNPRRHLDVGWKEPKMGKPTKYQVVIVEKDSGNSVDKILTESTNVRFTDLKSKTKYSAKVIAIYGTKPSHASESENVVTDASLEATPKKELVLRTPIRNDKPYKGGEVVLYWNHITFDEVYKTLSYTVEASYGRLWKYELPTQHVEVNENTHELRVSFNDLKPNVHYCAIVTANLLNLDTREKFGISCKKKFSLGFDEPKLHPVKQDGNKVTLKWEEIDGGSFDVEIKDAHTLEILWEAKKIKENEKSFQLNGKLRIGRTCKIILGVRSEDGDDHLKSESWIDWIIGGEKVPKDVNASKNPRNPHRCLDINFLPPTCVEKPLKYIINAHSVGNGPVKHKETKSNLETFERLRTDTKYYFEVIAVFSNGKKSKGSLSQTISTELPLVRTTHGPSIRGDHLQLRDVKVNTNVLAQQDPDFDLVREPLVQCGREVPCSDFIIVSWRPPLFGNNQDNFHVNYYWVVIRKSDKTAIFTEPFPGDEQTNTYRTEEIRVELGKTYTVAISCSYENIDEMKDSCQSRIWEGVYRARPCKPSIINKCDEESGMINIEWSPVDGAKIYMVEIFIDGATEPAFSHRAIDTKWSFKFNDRCTFGNTYRARLTAIWDEKTNSDESAPQIIGGDMVPREAKATRGIGNAATTASLEWKAPLNKPDQDDKKPDHYRIVKISDSGDGDGDAIGKRHGTSDRYIENGERSDKTEKQIVGLNPGTAYRFRIHAVFGKDVGGGCLSNEIKTDPGPGKVKVLDPQPNKEDGSTKIDIHWEAEEHSSLYKVEVECVGKWTKSFYDWTEATSYTAEGLIPGTTYRISVTGRSHNEGFGNPSDVRFIKTKYGMVKEIRLSLMKDDEPQSKIKVVHGEAQGLPKSYRITTLDSTTRSQINEPILGKPNGSVVIDGLSPNSKYFVTVEAEYADENGDSVFGQSVKSENIRTAARKPDQIHITQHRIRETNTIKLRVKWNQDPECKGHQLEIKKGLETELFANINNSLEWEYHVMDQTCQYAIRIRSQNDSECYGAWSEFHSVFLAPRPLKNVQSKVLEDGKIAVTWDKPLSQIKNYIIVPYCNVAQEVMQTSSIPQYIMSKPTPSSDYYFIVTAVGMANGEVSAESKSNVVYSNSERCQNLDVQLQSQATLAISWNKVEKCTYEVKIARYWTETDGQKKLAVEAVLNCETNETLYTCAKHGSRYSIAVRAKYKTAYGEWSDPKDISNAPSAVKHLKLQSNGNILNASWTQPRPRPQEYHLQLFEYDILKGGCKKLGEIHKPKETEDSRMTFKESVPHGRAYCCEIVAVSNGTKSLATQSGIVFTAWEKPTSFMVKPDKKDPSHRAYFEWRGSERVNCFKLVISSENKEGSGIPLSDPKYHMQNGEPGTTYHANLFWGFNGQISQDSITKNFTLAPAKVLGAELTENDTGDLQLSWNKVIPTPDNYLVRWNEGDGEQHREELSGENNWLVIKAKSGCTVEAKVCAMNEFGCGEFSEECKNFLTPTPPSAICVVIGKERPDTSFVVRIEDTQDPRKTYIYQAVEVKRDANPATVEEQTAVEKEQDAETEEIAEEESGKPISREVKTRDCLLTGLKPGVAYLVSVQTKTNEKLSCAIVYTEPVRTRPPKIDGITAEQGKPDLHFKWTAPACPVKNYHIELKSNDGKVLEYCSNENCFSVHDPRPGNLYSIRVAAENSSGLGVMCNWMAKITAPGPTACISATLTADGVGLDWVPPKGRVSEYSVEYKNENEHIPETATDAPKYLLKKPKCSHTYLFRVRAKNPGGVGDWSPWKIFKTVPGKVMNVRANVTTNSIRLEWDPPIPNVPNKYMVEMKNAEVKYTVRNSHKQTGLSPAKSYQFRVAALNETGCGEMSEWYETYTDPVPPKIINVENVISYDDRRSFVVTIEDEADAEKLYVVKAISEKPREPAKVVKTRGDRVEIKNLAPGFGYKVVAFTRFRDKESTLGVYTGKAAEESNTK